MQITKNIGPLVNCMCNDMKRQFFKSNTYWRKCIVGFVQLISDITRLCLAPNSNVEASSSERKVVLDILLQHEGLLTSIVQWRFWRTERPDIFRELQIEISMSNSDARLGFNLCTDIAKIGNKIMDLLILNGIKNEDFAMYQRGKEKKLGNVAGAATTLISDNSRVYKGASWKDRAYYLNPGTRRFLDENKSTSTIGFRCAMDRVGSPVGLGAYE